MPFCPPARGPCAAGVRRCGRPGRGRGMAGKWPVDWRCGGIVPTLGHGLAHRHPGPLRAPGLPRQSHVRPPGGRDLVHARAQGRAEGADARAARAGGGVPAGLAGVADDGRRRARRVGGVLGAPARIGTDPLPLEAPRGLPGVLATGAQGAPGLAGHGGARGPAERALLRRRGEGEGGTPPLGEGQGWGVSPISSKGYR